MMSRVGGLLKVYSRFTQGLLKVYSRFTQGLLKVYSRFTQGLLKVYSRFTQGLLKVYSRFTQGLLKVYSRFTQGLVFSISLFFLLGILDCTKIGRAYFLNGLDKPLPEITDLSVNRDSSGITLRWKNPASRDRNIFNKLLILKNTNPIQDRPRHWRDYPVSTVMGASRVVYNAAAPTFTDREVVDNVVYFYKIFVNDTFLYYNEGVQAKVDKYTRPPTKIPPPINTPPSPDTEPPANVRNHTLQSISNGITLTWSNPADSDFSKVLILKHTSPIVDSPTTGRDYASGTSIGSSSVVYNGNLETLRITDNTANVLSYYKIFAYDTLLNYASGVELSGRRNADSDGDGLIEIYTAEMLDNMHHDLAGLSYKTSANDAGNTDGCPTVVNGSGGCNGYELTANIDLLSLLDANGNGMIDTTMEGIDKNADGDTDDTGEKVTVIDTTADTSWVPIGDNSTDDDITRFTGIFEGNNHTIANLWVNVAFPTNDIYAGLFGVTGGTTVTIRNLEIISGSIYSYSTGSVNPVSGGLVGRSTAPLTIMNSTFSGSGGVFSSSATNSTNTLSRSGGMVGQADNTLTIIKCIFSASGGVSSSSTNSSSRSDSGGLVGYYGGISTITNSTFSGSGGVSSSSTTTGDSLAGGLVGFSNGISTITNSYFSGSDGVSSSTTTANPVSGGLVGANNFALTIMNSYFSGGKISSDSSSSSSYSGGLVGGGNASLTIMNSYFSGSGGVFSSATTAAFLGGLVGHNSTSLTITNGYWNTNASQMKNNAAQNPKRARGDTAMNPSGTTGLTLVQLQAITGIHPSGLPHGATDDTKAWDLGTDMQLPAVKLCIPTIINSVPNWAMCASYGALLPGQR